MTLTSCTGVITTVLPNTDKKILGFNVIAPRTNKMNSTKPKAAANTNTAKTKK